MNELRSAGSRPRPYIPEIAKSVIKAAQAHDAAGPVLNLSLNESSHGASPKATAAAEARAARLHRYPDPASTELRTALGRAHDLDPDRIICGNGSEELLDIIGRLYARAGDEIVFGQYGFMQFPIVAMRTGATAAIAPEDDTLVPSVDALLAQVTPRTRIVFLANPNNPTGTYLPADEVRRLRDGLPRDVVLVVDSAYAEYVVADDYSAGHGLVEGYENVIVTHTFSKAFGLAALRIGWAYGSASMIGVMNRMRGIGNVNAIAQAGAVAALDDLDFVARVRDETARDREHLARELAALGLTTVPSQANFVMARFPKEGNRSAAAALSHLISHGIVVRGVEDYGLDDWLRITIGLGDENARVLDALRGFLV